MLPHETITLSRHATAALGATTSTAEQQQSPMKPTTSSSTAAARPDSTRAIPNSAAIRRKQQHPHQHHQQQQPKRPIMMPVKSATMRSTTTPSTHTVLLHAPASGNALNKTLNENTALLSTVSPRSPQPVMMAMTSRGAPPMSPAVSPIRERPKQQRHLHHRLSTLPFGGYDPEELVPRAVDKTRLMRKANLDVAIPDWSPMKVSVPKFMFTVDTLKAPVLCATGDGLQTVERFCSTANDPDDGVIVRALQYHTFPEASSLFVQQPSISPDGTLRFVPSASVHGTTNVWVRLADNSSVGLDRDVCTSEPQMFVVKITPRNGALSNQSKAPKDAKLVSSKANAHASPVPQPPPISLSVTTTAAAAAQIMEDTSTATAVIPVGGSHDVTVGGGVGFDTTMGTVNSNTMSPTRRALNSTATMIPLAGSPRGLDLTAQGYHFPATEFRLLHRDPTAVVKLSVACPMSALDRIRVAHLLQERTKLLGDPVPLIHRASAEEKLKERVEAEMERNGGDEYSRELIPVLMRLVQLHYHSGPEHHSEALSAMHRIVQIQFRQNNATSMADLDVEVPTSEPEDEVERSRVHEAIKKLDDLVLSLHAAGTLCKHLGHHVTAVEYFRDAAEVAVRTHSRDNLFTMRARVQLAEVLCCQGKFHEALPIYEHCLDTADVLLGSFNPTYTALMQYVGFAASMAGDHARGVECQQRAVAARKQQQQDHIGDAPSDHARSHTFLLGEAMAFHAHAQLTAGRTLAAIETYRAAVEVVDQYDIVRVPEYTVGLAFMLTLLAEAYTQDNQINDAVSCLRKAIDLQRAQGVDDVDDVELACMETEFASLLWNHNLNRSESRETTLRCLSVMKRALGELHPYTLQVSLNYMALFERVPQKRDLTTACSAYLAKQLNPVHPSALCASEMLAQLFLDEHAYAEALEVLLGLDHSLGDVTDVNPLIERCLTRLATAYAYLKEHVPDNIVQRAYKLLKLMQKKYGEWSSDCIPLLLVIARMCHANGEQDRAQHYLTKALKIADKHNMVFLLGHLFRPASQLTPAEIAERDRMAEERMTPAVTLQFANILFCIAVTYEAQNKVRDAELTYMQSLASFEIARQPTHAGVCSVLEAIGSLLFAQGMFGDALCYFEKAVKIRDDSALEASTSEQPYFERLFDELGRPLDHSTNIVQQELWRRGYVLTRNEHNHLRFAVYM
eukprot:PhM_4_TR14123/c1_g1_i1/m.91037